MDENAKKILYRQLKEMHENNKNKTDIITEEEFLLLQGADALKYILNYRENADFGIDEESNQRIVYYIEMPDMDLSGQDLSGVRLAEFIPATLNEDNILKPSNINLQNTNAIINVSDIGYNKTQINEDGIIDYIINFETINFNGCEIYGILPDEYAEYEKNPKSRLKSKIITVDKEGHLDEEYLERRKDRHLSKEEKERADRAYERIMEGKTVKGMRGVNDGIDFTDYDFQNLTEEQRDALIKSVVSYNIEIIDEDICQKIEEFVEKHWYNVSLEIREKVFYKAYKKGNTEFAEKYWDDLSREIRKKILNEAYEKGDMEFVEKYWEYLDVEILEKILKEAYKKGDMEFIENHWKYLYYVIREKLVKEAYEKGDMEFVEKYWEYLDVEILEDIVREEYKKGNMEFVEKHLEYLDYMIRTKILNEAYEKGDMELVEKHWGLLYYAIQEKLVEEAYEKGDMEFIEKHWKYLKYGCRQKLVKEAYEKGDTEFVEKHWSDVSGEIKDKILKEVYQKGDTEFIEKYWNQINNEDLFNIKNLPKTFDSNYINFITQLVNLEKKYTEEHGKSTVSRSGRMLYDLLHEEDINEEIALMLIQAGSDINYVGYNARQFYNDGIKVKEVKYTPIIMSALKIKDEKKKERIITELLKAGVNIDAEETTIEFTDKGKNTNKIKAFNDNEFRQLVSTYRKNQEKTNNPDEQKSAVIEFLTKEIGLQLPEIERLEEIFQNYSNSVYNQSLERLKLQTKILSAVNCEKKAFREFGKILFIDPKTLYARLKFFEEQNITINPERINTTIGISNKGFANNFGSLILGQGEKSRDYSYELKKELLRRYPMPKKEEELTNELLRISQKYQERGEK